jgi:hypothetical protein
MLGDGMLNAVQPLELSMPVLDAYCTVSQGPHDVSQKSAAVVVSMWLPHVLTGVMVGRLTPPARVGLVYLHCRTRCDCSGKEPI